MSFVVNLRFCWRSGGRTSLINWVKLRYKRERGGEAPWSSGERWGLTIRAIVHRRGFESWLHVKTRWKRLEKTEALRGLSRIGSGVHICGQAGAWTATCYCPFLLDTQSLAKSKKSKVFIWRKNYWKYLFVAL